jgi:hypothetical protein
MRHLLKHRNWYEATLTLLFVVAVIALIGCGVPQQDHNNLKLLYFRARDEANNWKGGEVIQQLQINVQDLQDHVNKLEKLQAGEVRGKPHPELKGEARGESRLEPKGYAR